jgi:hypothetical protein
LIACGISHSFFFLFAFFFALMKIPSFPLWFLLPWSLSSVLLLWVDTAVGLASSPSSPVKVGDKVPPAVLHFGFPPQKVFLPSYAANKKMILIGLPGAFTPT